VHSLGGASSGTTPSIVARSGSRVVEAELIGRYKPSSNLKFGTTSLGNEAHDVASQMLMNELKDRGIPLGAIIVRTGSGTKGVDMSIDKVYTYLVGYSHIEIKPNTASGLKSFNSQLSRWGLDSSSVQVVTYDANGNIRWGFEF
jgi:hypothetical protein